jgi:hypothetical protein
MIIDRPRHLQRIRELLRTHPVVAILGARQVGKTTLAREFAGGLDAPVTRFDLEDPDDVARLAEPKLALAPLDGLVILDEVQRRPELFPVLRVLVDRPNATTRFLVLGSAGPELLRQSSETLAGRIAYHELEGLGLDEVGLEAAPRLWLRGGFPRSFLAQTERDSFEWRRGFVRTFLERDLPSLGVQIPAPPLHRFWQMLSHYHGQTWNGAELARAFGVAATTVRRYLDLLASALVVRLLPPWFENIAKRQVKSPKVYIADTGVLHTLLGIMDVRELEGHPKIGASWEGFVIKELVAHLGARPEELFFWATHAGAELDLLVVRGRRRLGFEIKRTTSPASTRSMQVALATLRLESLEVIHAGEHTFPLASGIRAVAFSRMLTDLQPL